MISFAALRNLFLSYSAGEFVAKGLNLLVVVLLPFVLPPEEYGRVALLIAIEAVGFNFVIGGVAPALVRMYPRFKRYPHQFVLSSFRGWFVFAVPAAIVLLAVTYAVDRLMLSRGHSSLMLLVFVLSIVISAFRENVFSILRVEERVRLYLSFKIVSQVVKFLAVLALAHHWKISDAYIVGSFAAACIGFATLKEYSSELFASRQVYRRAIARATVHTALPLLVTSVIGVVMIYADRYVIEWYLAVVDVGVYSLVSTVAGSSFFLINMVTLAFLPGFFAHRRWDSEAARYLRRMTAFSLAIVGVASLGLYGAFAAITQLALPEYENGLSLMPVLLVKYSLLPLSLHGTYQLMLLNRTSYLPALTAVACVVNLALNVVAIPHFGLMGAAYASLGSELLLTALTLASARLVLKSH